MKKVLVYLLSFLALYIFSCGSGDVAFNKKSWNASAFDEKIKDEEAYRKMDISRMVTKVIEIGDWNMDATTQVSVAHGLDYKKIRQIQAVIRNDIDTEYQMIDIGTSIVDVTRQGFIGLYSVGVILGRLAGGKFDDVAYDSTNYNRGWITIWYEG